MTNRLSDYEAVAGKVVIDQLRRLGTKLEGKKVIHVNSTREGGGVAEILAWMVPLMQDLGIDTQWQVIKGDHSFFTVTKSIHNALQGDPVTISKDGWDKYYSINAKHPKKMIHDLEDADIVVIHDPQPAALINHAKKRKGKWAWRAHIDISHPFRPVWKELRSVVENYDAGIFSMSQFAQPLPYPQFIIPPSIDPLSEKNRELDEHEIEEVRQKYGINPDLPLLVQVSRFDRFKDPIGVIKAYNLVKPWTPVQIVLAGGTATDDPEGKMVLEEVLEAAQNDPNIHILLLPPDAHRDINALQRMADIIIQKSTKEGFGLTVTEGLWKAKPVIGGDVGGIRLQVFNHFTGFLVNTPEGAAHRIRYLLRHRSRIKAMGQIGKTFVRENFLLTRHLREYLTLFLVITSSPTNRVLYV